MEEGGWTCDWESGSVRSSIHSTLNSLLGILYYELGSEWFAVDVPVGQPSKWLTLRSLRTLRWWEEIE